jgi:LysR family transcriptional regulator, low CO2-responsive transcriptional regulator
MISLNQLSKFMEVARSGSVRLTAERLVVSQPAVSSALAVLQRTIGVRLVERDGRKLRLTPAGECLGSYGRRIFALLDEATFAVRAAANPQFERLRLSAVTTAAEQLLPDLLGALRSHGKTLDVDLYVGNKNGVWDRLRHWETDLVLAGRPPRDAHFRSAAIRANTVIAIGQAGTVYDVESLSRATWLLREPGSGTRETTEAFFAQLGIAPAAVTIGSNGAIRECVRAGLGISLMSLDAVARAISDGTLQEIPTPVTPLVRDWHLVTSAEREMSIGARQFVEFAIASGAFHVPLE